MYNRKNSSVGTSKPALQLGRQGWILSTITTRGSKRLYYRPPIACNLIPTNDRVKDFEFVIYFKGKRRG